ncbi:MAG: glycosyltransferase family 4 protein [bacterium]
MDEREIKPIDTLLITLDYYPNVGGVARYLLSYAKKNNVNVLCGGADFVDEKEQGVSRKKLLWGFWPKWLPLLFWGLVYLRRYEKLAVSHILPAGYVALLAKKPFILILHGLDIINAGKGKWKRYWAKKILDRADKIIVNSHATGELLRQIFGDLYKYEIEYPAIFPLRSPQKNLKAEYGLADKKIILSLGRLVERKGQEKIIRLMPKILQEAPEAVFVIAGGGPERQNLENLAKTFGVSEQVIFLGKAKESEISEIYDMCDIFVAPSLPSKDDWEGFGMVCLEAAYFGKPVIVSNVGGLPEAVENNVTGFVAQNDEELLEKIITLLKDEELRNRLGEVGKERVKKYFLI